MKKILSIDNKIYSSVTYDTVADLDITGVGGWGVEARRGWVWEGG